MERIEQLTEKEKLQIKNLEFQKHRIMMLGERAGRRGDIDIWSIEYEIHKILNKDN